MSDYETSLGQLVSPQGTALTEVVLVREDGQWLFVRRSFLDHGEEATDAMLSPLAELVRALETALANDHLIAVMRLEGELREAYAHHADVASVAEQTGCLWISRSYRE